MVDVEASNISQNSSSSAAIYGYGYYEDTQLWLQQVSINGTGYGDGLEITPYDYSSYTATFSINLDNVEITDAADNGITLSTTRTEANIESSTVQGSGGYGIYANNSWITLSDSVVSMNGLSGIYLDNATGEINGTEASYNGDYGWVCFDTTLDSCIDNTQSDNEDGRTSGCEETCP